MIVCAQSTLYRLNEANVVKSKTIANPKIKTWKSTHNKQSKQIAVDQHKLLYCIWIGSASASGWWWEWLLLSERKSEQMNNHLNNFSFVRYAVCNYCRLDRYQTARVTVFLCVYCVNFRSVWYSFCIFRHTAFSITAVFASARTANWPKNSWKIKHLSISNVFTSQSILHFYIHFKTCKHISKFYFWIN